jgi:hypothetical protein
MFVMVEHTAEGPNEAMTRFVGRRSRVVIGAAVLTVAAGAVAYLFLGTTTQVDGRRMARLVVPTTRIAQFESHPLESTFAAPSKSSLSLVKQAGASHPTETGAYQRSWRTKSSKASGASVLVQLLPTPTLARSLQHQLTNNYTDVKKLTAQSLDLTQKFTVAALPGAFAASYTEKSSTTSSSGSTNVYVVVFQVNRVEVFVLMQSSSTAIGEQDSSSLAVSEAEFLRSTEPGFSLAQTVRPASRALLFGLGTLTAAGVILVLPWIIGLMTQRRERSRERKEERERLRARHHIRSRGSSVMRRQRAPAGRKRPPTKRRSR